MSGVRPDPGPARDLVRAELAKSEYQPSLFERVMGWFGDLLDKLTHAADGLGRLDPIAAVLLLVVILSALAVALARLRRDPVGRARTGTPLLPETRISADAHRRLAERAHEQGRYDDVVREALRAIAVGLAERAIIDDLPGATAREVTRRAGAAFAGLAVRLDRAADHFDAVMYGDRHADRATAEDLLDLERTVRGARPSDAAGARSGPVAAVPS